jgi:ribose transport system substrate-binding protein
MITAHSSHPAGTSAHPPGTSNRGHTGLWVALVTGAVLVVAGILWYEGAFSPKPRVALVTASQGPYWDLIIKGAQEAAERHGVRLEVVRPPSDEGSQTKAIRSLIDQGYDGVAVSPTNADTQARVLAEVGAKSNLVTFDSDAPIARRLCFVGTDNYDAGRMAGQHVREALPDGGKVVIAIGSVSKENGHRRRQGVIDELLEREFEPLRPMDMPLNAPLKGAKYTVVTTLVDDLNPQRAMELAAEAVKANPDLGCFVGLFASNTPAILKALEQTGKLGQIKVVGFDANEETLAGIEKGYVYASIVQDAYNIGYQAVRILADAAEGEPNAVPLYPTFYLRCDPVVKENLAEMRQAMASRTKPQPHRPSTQPAERSATQPAEAGPAEVPGPAAGAEPAPK